MLELVYKYRFVSLKQIAVSLNIKYGSSLQERFDVLVKHSYLARRFEKRLKLLGVPAAYYLTPKGIRALRALPGHERISDSIIKLTYNDDKRSIEYVHQFLHVYEYTNLLNTRYPSLKVFGKRELSAFAYFPSQPPDAYLSLPSNGRINQNAITLTLYQIINPRPALESMLINYYQFFDNGGWNITSSPLPTMLLVCESPASERRIPRAILSAETKSDYDELEWYTATTKALESMDADALIWTNVDDSDELQSLEDIS